MQKIIIVGNAIAADIIFTYLQQDERYEVVCFSVDKDYITEVLLHELPVIPPEALSERFNPQTHRVLMALGYNNLNRTREMMFNRVKAMGYTVETYIHPDANVYNGGKIGEGSIIMANTTVEVFAELGNNSVVWANCVIGHHAVVGDNCWIASGAVLAGEATVGLNGFVGVNATIANQVNVADFNIIGANTAIHKHTKDNQVYLSSHGEKIRFNAEQYAEYFLK